MAVKLEALIKQVENTGIKLVGGKGGLSNPVEWVHIVGNMETAGFLKGGEIVFTTGIGMEKEISLLMLTEKIYHNNASGLIVNIGPYIKEIPDEVITFSNDNNFPVFTVPWEIYLADMMRIFCYAIQQNEQKEMELSSAFKYCLYASAEEELYMPTLMKKGYSKKSKYTVAVTNILEKTIISPDKIIYSDLINERQRQLLKIWSGAIQEQRKNAVSFWDENYIVTILSDIDDKEGVTIIENARQWLNRYLKENESVWSSLGKTVCKISELKESYRTGKMTERYTRKILNDESISCYSDMGLAGLLFNIKNDNEIKAFCKKTVYPIKEYDLVNDTNLYHVLRSYMSHNGSVNQVAEEMFVHRNTVNYKIRKIEQILNVDLTDFKVRSELMAGIIADDIQIVL
ncbi:PucR family transcriptional regulator [Agathobacter sp.]